MAFSTVTNNSVPTDLTYQWQVICHHIIEEFGETHFHSWIKPLIVTQNGDSLVLVAPTRFMRDWVSTHYLSRIQSLTNLICPDIKNVMIESADTVPTSTLTPGVIDVPSMDPVTRRLDDIVEDNGDCFQGAPLDPRFTFDNFIVGKTNELAYAAALRVAESATTQYNPLFLYGGVGLGKTHLMHAIAWRIRECHPQRRVIYLSAEKFMYQFIKALRYKDTVAFKDQFRNVNVLMIDDVQFIGGKETTQEEFFHTFNALVDQNHQIIVSADKSPSDLAGVEDRLKSRLGWGLVADIHPTTYELRLGILQSKADSLSGKIPQDVMEFLAFKITSNIRELEGALNRVVAHATLVGREITLEMAQDVLRDVLKANDRRLTIEEIQKRICEYYSVKLVDLNSSKRSQNLARPRQMAMYLAKNLTSKSLPEIGRKFGGRDHTTVLHAIRKVDELCSTDRSFADDLDFLKKSLQSA